AEPAVVARGVGALEPAPIDLIAKPNRGDEGLRALARLRAGAAALLDSGRDHLRRDLRPGPGVDEHPPAAGLRDEEGRSREPEQERREEPHGVEALPADQEVARARGLMAEVEPTLAPEDGELLGAIALEPQ